MKIEFSLRIFEKYSNIKLNEKLSSGSRVVPYGRTDRRTDMTKLVVTFRNFAKSRKKESLLKYIHCPVQDPCKKNEPAFLNSSVVSTVLSSVIHRHT